VKRGGMRESDFIFSRGRGGATAMGFADVGTA